ncbi:MAG: hypothetical protein CMN75_03910, partial [Spirochaeta sp.]|nr:hypothetical protein [Spirochaeta sp.]
RCIHQAQFQDREPFVACTLADLFASEFSVLGADLPCLSQEERQRVAFQIGDDLNRGSLVEEERLLFLALLQAECSTEALTPLFEDQFMKIESMDPGIVGKPGVGKHVEFQNGVAQAA